MVQGWSKRAPLSRGEASVFRDLLMSAMTVPFVFADVEHSSNVLDGQPGADSAFQRSLDGIAVPGHEQFVHFWVFTTSYWPLNTTMEENAQFRHYS